MTTLWRITRAGTIHHSTVQCDNDGCTRVVVINPDDTEQVERLTALLDWALHPNDSTRLGETLREYARPTPPRPEEPQGLGAVVEDNGGRAWVHFGNGCWIAAVPNAQLDQITWEWLGLNNAAMHNAGVTP